MDDRNRTLKCITISTIESIINDDNVFSDKTTNLSPPNLSIFTLGLNTS